VIALREMRVGRGIPGGGIDAVEDAAQRVAPRPQQAIHPATLLRRLDLARVSGAYRVERIRIDDAALEKRKAPVELQRVDAVELARQPQAVQHARLEVALVGEIVDGKERGGAGRALETQVDRGERARPVVAMHDLRPPA